MAKSSDNPFPDFEALMKQFKVPGVDVTSMLEAQRKNFEALTTANKVATEGYRALAERQAEMIQEIVEQWQHTARDLMSADAPEESAGKRAALAQEAFERAIENMRELNEIAVKSQSEALEVLNKRMMASLQEMHDQMGKAAK